MNTEDLKIKQIPQAEVLQLRNAWNVLEKGKDMTVFQSFDWFCSIIKDYIPAHVLAYCFYIYHDLEDGQEEPILIAPLYIIPRIVNPLIQKSCCFWGRVSYSDYMNLIYDKFVPEAIELLFYYIKQKYKIDYYRFDFLLEHTQLAKYILNNKTIKETHKSTCVHVDLNSTSAERFSRLSKHTKQNFRTAINRAEKDGVVFKTEYVEVIKDQKILKECYNLWHERLEFKQHREWSSMSFLEKIKVYISHYFNIKYTPPYNVMLKYKYGWLFVVYSSGIITSFFWGIIDKNNNSLIVILVGTNPLFARYSPGLRGINKQIEQWMNDKSFSCIDFTRGNERYKYDLGGENHYICDIQFKV